MKTIAGWKALTFALLLACPTSAWAIGTVSDGSVSFGYPTDFNTSPGNTVNTNLTGASPGDQLYESWWFFRVTGDGQETAFATPDLEDYTLNGGTTGQLDWSDPTGLGLFSGQLFFEVIETASGQGVVFQNLIVENTSASVLDIDIFHYTDLDLSGTSRRDDASLVANPDGIEMMISDSRTGATAPFLAYNADAYQVSDYANVLNSLTDTGVTNLDNSGLPFSGRRNDFTTAFQWGRSIGVGDKASFLTQFGSDSALIDPALSQIPEPSPLLLASLGLSGLASFRRRPRLS